MYSIAGDLDHPALRALFAISSICRITLAGVDINRQQITRGMARMYRQYAADASYIAAEVEAQAAKRGLWAEGDPMPPWDFRRARQGRRKDNGERR